MSKELEQRITDYLSGGGLFNPELADHAAVRDLLIECRANLQAAKPEQAQTAVGLPEAIGILSLQDDGPMYGEIDDDTWGRDDVGQMTQGTRIYTADQMESYATAHTQEAIMELVEVLKQCRIALEPYDDIKPRDWKTDRERLRYAHQSVCDALDKYAPKKEQDNG